MLADFNVTKPSDLKPEQYDAFMGRCLKSKPNPTSSVGALGGVRTAYSTAGLGPPWAFFESANDGMGTLNQRVDFDRETCHYALCQPRGRELLTKPFVEIEIDTERKLIALKLVTTQGPDAESELLGQ